MNYEVPILVDENVLNFMKQSRKPIEECTNKYKKRKAKMCSYDGVGINLDNLTELEIPFQMLISPLLVREKEIVVSIPSALFLI